MSLKSSLFMKLLQLVFTVSDREWRLRLYVQCCLEVACSKRDEYCSVCSQKKVVVHVSCELRRRKIVTETRKNELGENWLQGLLRNFFLQYHPLCNIDPLSLRIRGILAISGTAWGHGARCLCHPVTASRAGAEITVCVGSPSRRT